MTIARHGLIDGVTAEQVAERADLVDADVAGQAAGRPLQPLERAEIGMAAGREQPGDRMIGRRFQARKVDRRARRLGQHPRRRHPGEARLADPLGPGQQPGMVQPARLPGAGELLDRLVLADDHGSRSPSA